MTNDGPQLGTWRAAVAQLESETMDVWARPLTTLSAGFALGASTLIAGRLLDSPVREPVQLAALAALVGLGLITLWRTRRIAADALAQQIVHRLTKARDVIRGLPADLRTTIDPELGRLSAPISPSAVGGLTVLAVFVSAVAAVAGTSLAHGLAPELGTLSVGAGLAVSAVLLPGYVRLVTATAAERVEERAVLVERLADIAGRG
jgi:hypothetical protein